MAYFQRLIICAFVALLAWLPASSFAGSTFNSVSAVPIVPRISWGGYPTFGAWWAAYNTSAGGSLVLVSDIYNAALGYDVVTYNPGNHTTSATELQYCLSTIVSSGPHTPVVCNPVTFPPGCHPFLFFYSLLLSHNLWSVCLSVCLSPGWATSGASMRPSSPSSSSSHRRSPHSRYPHSSS